MNPLKISRQTKSDADEMLASKNLLSILAKYGVTRVGGSYFMDLMFDPDIDIDVATDTPRESATQFLNEVIEAKLFQKYQYGDMENYPRDNRPKDHIIVLILPFNGQKWEIEIWFTRALNPEQATYEQKLKDLPRDKKDEIVAKKAKRSDDGINKHQLSSMDIYRQYVEVIT